MFGLMFWVVVVLSAIVFLLSVRSDIRELRRRIEQLERAAPSRHAAPETSAPPVAVAPHPPLAAGPPPLPVPPAASPPPKPPNADRLEDLIGGVWFQNLGAVLLLVGVFFLIVWGWTTGRFGPGVLVVAGVLAGAILVWRGDRLRHSLQGLGHAFIGIGFGVMYVTLYLGHFTLRVLPAPVAVIALVAVSGLTLVAGLNYRVQSIAALGVVGAYLPQLLSGLLHIGGFSLPPAALLSWIAAVALLVFALAARAGWSGLDLSALFLASVTWVGSHPRGDWGWPITIGLAGMFTALGLAPLPRLVRTEGRVRPIDLAVIVVAPLGFIASSWPMLALANARLVAMLLFALAAFYAAAATWVDQRRPERDLWRPLTGAAIAFLTAALERALGTDYTPLAWSVEGALLFSLGLAPRAGWLRLLGGLALALGAMWGFGQVAESIGQLVLPGSPLAVRTIVIVVAVLLVGHLLARRRDQLTSSERHLPECVVGIGHLLLALWFTHEAWATARAFEGPNGAWQLPPSIARPPGSVRASALTLAICTFAWTVQAAWLAWAGARKRRVALRIMAAMLLGFAMIVSFLALAVLDDPWSRDWLPVLHAPGLLHLSALVLVVAAAGRLAAQRDALTAFDRRSPELWALAAALVMLAWISREADHVARALLGLPGPNAPASADVTADAFVRRAALAPVFTSVGWLAQALGTTAIGWWRGSAFLRWMGLALVGLTALKFVLRDLVGTDPFWRFLTAIVAGAAMLAMSWVYQVKQRGKAAAPRDG